MLKNYLKIAFRNLKKNKGYSFINIAGLAVGISCCILILLYVNDETSYDKFNRNANQIYRVSLNGIVNGNDINIATSPSPMGPAIINELPEIKNYTRVLRLGDPVLRYEDKTFSEEKFFYADSSFFNVFTVKFLKGIPGNALTQPNTIVITEKSAKKYFGNEDPVGKILNANGNKDWLVTGVIKEFPAASHFHFDFLASLTSIEDSRNPYWLSNNYYTYLLLQKGTNPEEFQKKLNTNILKYIEPQVKKAVGINLNEFKRNGGRYNYILMPLAGIHLHSHFDYEIEPNSNISYIYILSIIAIAILLIACINFINLSTARAEKRTKEIGIRKTLGSNKFQLIKQFITEAIIMCFFAVFLAIVFIEVFLPYINYLSDKELKLDVFGSIYALPLFILLTILLGITAGSYPAFYLSSFQPIKILTGKLTSGNKKSFLRSGLVIFQFTVAVILFIGTFIVFQQLQFIQNKNLGFNKEQVVIINKTDDIGKQISAFKNDLLNNPDVISVSNSTAIPGDQKGDSAFRLEGTDNNQIINGRHLWCDYDFASVYKIDIKNGRFFSKEFGTDDNSVIINETAAKMLGSKNPVGKNLIRPMGQGEETFKIIGVTKDFNYESLHQQVRPLIIYPFSSKDYGKFTSVRIKSGNITGTLNYFEDTWKKFASDQVFNYNFLDKNLETLYNAEQRTATLAATFSILAIFIACFGLLGLIAFVAEQRTKEIGIRKVLGATVSGIVSLLSKEYLKLIVISNLIAWPLAYFVMNKWLEDFAYRIQINFDVFLFSGLIVLVIAISTIGIQVLKAATANPVKSIKYE